MIIPSLSRISSFFSLLVSSSIEYCQSELWSTPSFSSEYRHLPTDYGVDHSYPIHYPFADNSTFFARRYNEMLTGCYKMYTEEECKQTEYGRLKMSLEQPRTQYNYTELGFKKLRAPRVVHEALLKYYHDNKANRKEEQWSRAYTYTNHWDSPSYMISVEDTSFPGGGLSFKEFIWNNIRPVIEEWTGHELRPTSLYGIRVYTNNSVLATHVDRLPLVSSCIINVDQEEMAEPWELEVYDHAGKAHNVTMAPGDLVLYESSTVLHGRPFPMNGKNYANIFIHFEPLDHDQMNLKALPTHDLAQAAASGNLQKVKDLISTNADLIHERDHNGWAPIHEAVRGGKIEVVKFLLEKGADIASLTNSGASPLWWAKESLRATHPMIGYLKSIGAPDIGPLHDEL